MRTRLLSALRLPLLLALSLGGCANIIGLEDYSSPSPPDAGGKPGTCALASFRACYAGAPETQNEDACHAGVQVCNKDGTAWGPCIGAAMPSDGASSCTCAPGDEISCYDGPLAAAGVGLCATGKRTCNEQGTAYGPCEGAILPGYQTCGDGTDANCDGVADCNGSYRWANRYGGPTAQEGWAIATDAAGNVFVTGYLTGEVEVGGIATHPFMPGGADDDVFLLKLDPLGRHLWSKRFGNAAAQFGVAVAVDAQGNVFITGRFAGSLAFDPSKPLTSNGGTDIFVAGFNPEGELLWAKGFDDAAVDMAKQLAYGIAADPKSGDVVITGSFVDTLDFSGGMKPLTASGAEDAFVAKLNGTSGAHLWSKRFGGALSSVAHGLAIAVEPQGDGDIVVTGDFDGIVDFGGGAKPGNGDGFVLKLTASGGYLWNTPFGVAGTYQGGGAVAVDSNGDVLLAGPFGGTVPFGGDVLTAQGSGSFFLSKLDGTKGTFVWSSGFGLVVPGGSPGVAVDRDGDVVLLTGSITGDIDFGGGTLMGSGMPGDVDLAVAKFDPSGKHLWSKRFGGLKAGGATQLLGNGLAIDPLGNVLLTGSNLGGGLDFGGGVLANAGNRDIFVASLAP